MFNKDENMVKKNFIKLVTNVFKLCLGQEVTIDNINTNMKFEVNVSFP